MLIILAFWSTYLSAASVSWLSSMQLSSKEEQQKVLFSFDFSIVHSKMAEWGLGLHSLVGQFTCRRRYTITLAVFMPAARCEPVVLSLYIFESNYGAYAHQQSSSTRELDEQ